MKIINKFKNLKFFIILVTILFCFGFVAYSTQTLWIFQNGQSANAEHVNDNFSFLDNKINSISLTPGPAGPQGATGIQGPKGATGSQGLTGPKGTYSFRLCKCIPVGGGSCGAWGNLWGPEGESCYFPNHSATTCKYSGSCRY